VCLRIILEELFMFVLHLLHVLILKLAILQLAQNDLVPFLHSLDPLINLALERLLHHLDQGVFPGLGALINGHLSP